MSKSDAVEFLNPGYAAGLQPIPRELLDIGIFATDIPCIPPAPDKAEGMPCLPPGVADGCECWQQQQQRQKNFQGLLNLQTRTQQQQRQRAAATDLEADDAGVVKKLAAAVEAELEAKLVATPDTAAEDIDTWQWPGPGEEEEQVASLARMRTRDYQFEDFPMGPQEEEEIYRWSTEPWMKEWIANETASALLRWLSQEMLRGTAL